MSAPNKDVEVGGRTVKNLKWVTIALGFLVVFLVVMLTVCAVALVKIRQMPTQQAETITIENQRKLNIVRTNNVDDVEINVQEPTKEVSIKSMAEECEVLHHPADQEASIGSEVKLSCEFDRAVECRWLRRSNEIDIKQRYQYVTPRNEAGNYDCSINIRSIKDIDFGDWECVGLFEDQSSVRTNTAWLTKPKATAQKVNLSTSTTQVLVNPKSIEVPGGSEVTLDCEFSKEVDCAWLRRGEHIDIQGRYSYVDKAHSNNCSIKIKRTKPIDSGDWQCSSMADSESTGVTSSRAQITVK